VAQTLGPDVRPLRIMTIPSSTGGWAQTCLQKPGSSKQRPGPAKRLFSVTSKDLLKLCCSIVAILSFYIPSTRLEAADAEQSSNTTVINSTLSNLSNSSLNSTVQTSNLNSTIQNHSIQNSAIHRSVMPSSHPVTVIAATISPSSSSPVASQLPPDQYHFHAIRVADVHRCFRDTKIPPSPFVEPAVDPPSTTNCNISDASDCCLDDDVLETFPLNPIVPCNFVPFEFIECDEPVDHKKNDTARDVMGHGCSRWGGETWDQVEKTKVLCRVLEGIECWGPREFFKNGFPCIRYSGHYFVTTLLYSLLLGFLGVDRFCMGNMTMGVGKFLTIGGLGVWWLVDIVLLIQGSSLPADDSNWEPLF